MSKLLSRDAFREGVFQRDRHRCVICSQPAVDAHHILERRLWPDGGYYLDNGASLCEEHHLACERTVISVEQLREAAGITRPALPPHLYQDLAYDKWANIVMPNGSRLRGELFGDASVQKVLAAGGVLDLFSDRVKYPRTHHVPWSPGINDDDRVHPDMSAFAGRRVIATLKMDGENTTLYRSGLHARSVDSGSHPSRNWLKAFHARICGDIPDGWRVCGENLFASHSIAYSTLPSYFMGFSIWNEANECLPWDETLEWFELLGIQPVPVLFDGLYDDRILRKLHQPEVDGQEQEGWVLRLADGFNYGAFRTAMAKFVRAGHVQTTKHWMHGQPVVPNRLASGVSAY
jgi:hypothetical protein